MSDRGRLSISRREMLRGLVVAGGAALAAACSQPAAPSAPTAKPASPPTAASAAPTAAPAQAKAPTEAKPDAKPAAAAEWDALVDAAKKEGRLAALTGVGSSYRRIMDGFQAAFPGINVEHTALRGSDFAVRVQKERDAGLYAFDIAQVPTTTALTILRPAGVWDPVKPLITRPDLLDDKVWDGGFEAGWPDIEKKWAYAFANDKARSVWVNPSLVQPGEIKTFADIVDPKWKGKIVMADPRTEGRGYWPLTTLRITQGAGADEMIRTLLNDREILLGTDARQMTESMVRARYAIGIGAVDEQIIVDFQSQGLGTDLQALESEQWTYLSGTNIWAVNRAPHPNATKLFINWLLTKEAQELWSKETQTNSRRLDVEAASPERAPERGKKYVQIDAEDVIPKIDETRKLVTEVLK